MKPPAAYTMPDRPAVQTEIVELPVIDHPVLPTRQIRDTNIRCLRFWLYVSHFGRHPGHAAHNACS